MSRGRDPEGLPEGETTKAVGGLLEGSSATVQAVADDEDFDPRAASPEVESQQPSASRAVAAGDLS